jgi:hypothetical protein
MPEFVLELYISRADPGAADDGAARIQSAAEQLSVEGTSVRYLRTMLLPEEETCFYVCEAASAADMREVARRAGVAADNVAAALISPNERR